MRHPFDGIIQPNETDVPAQRIDEMTRATAKSPNRRSFLQFVAAGVTGLVGLLIGSKTNEARAAQLNYQGANRRNRVTTQALGEEGGGATTQAIGEEGGGHPRPPRPRPRPTTLALGEEGGGNTVRAPRKRP